MGNESQRQTFFTNSHCQILIHYGLLHKVNYQQIFSIFLSNTQIALSQHRPTSTNGAYHLHLTVLSAWRKISSTCRFWLQNLSSTGPLYRATRYSILLFITKTFQSLQYAEVFAGYISSTVVIGDDSRSDLLRTSGFAFQNWPWVLNLTLGPMPKERHKSIGIWYCNNLINTQMSSL